MVADVIEGSPAKSHFDCPSTPVVAVNDTMDFPVHAKRNADGCLRPRLMQAGDLVILYERHDCLDHFYLEAGSSFTNRFGFFPHNDMIGKPFGSRIYSKNIGGGYVYLLEPTPELWGQAMKVTAITLNL